MALTEVRRELNSDRLTVDGLKWVILRMACSQPELDALVTRYPENPTQYVQPIDAGKCCTDGPVCACNTAVCSCKCAGCMCDF